jgi:hypothetical protein
MKYIAIGFREIKPCIRHNCQIPALFVIVSKDTLKRRRKHSEYGTHYYACLAHKPANAEISEPPHPNWFGLKKLTACEIKVTA